MAFPKSDDDKNLNILLEANRKGKNKATANDTIEMVIVYNDDSIVSLSGGAILSGPIISSSTSENRLKSNQYGFTFENKVG